MLNKKFWGVTKPIKMPKKYYPRKVSEETKRIVYERDKGHCVLCPSTKLERVPHHAYWGNQSNTGEDRNNADQLVIICMKEHYEIHYTEDKKNKRKQCIDYLKNL